MVGKLKLTRNQLAQFLSDHESIKQFEALFSLADSLAPDFVNEVAIAAENAGSRANQALDGIQRIADALELISASPVNQEGNSIVTDYIDFNGTPPHSDAARRVVWNDADDTLNIHHSGNVVQQVGLEYYVRFANDTGAAIPKGTVVGLDYVGGVTTDNVVPFIADGSVPMLNIVGVTTQEVLNTESGRATVFGVVTDIDTTGTPYGETWAQGDVLYASTTFAGGFTKVKPTAPNWCVPLALVLFSDANFGQLFVRPTIDQPLYFGAFTKTADATPAAINTAYAITFDTTEVANGVSIGATTSQIIAEFSGLYNFSVSFQLTSGSASAKNVWLWFRKNGVDVSNSAMIVSLDSGSSVVSPSRDLFFSLAAGDYIELMWAADSTNVTLDARAATAFAPSAPSVTLIVSQEQQ